MTTVLPVTDADTTQAEEAGPGCGCCIPPPGAAGKDRVLADLQARRAAVERRLRGISTRV
jgi:hypothetical protein